MIPRNVILEGDVMEHLRTLPNESVDCVVTSPPYWGLRDYGLPPSTWEDGWTGCLGLEPSPDLFVNHLREVFREVRRVLKSTGTLWLVIGDSYAGKAAGWQGKSGDRASRTFTAVTIPKRAENLKEKDLCGIPWMTAFALRDDGWYLRSDTIWHKPNPMPENVQDRPTKSHEYLFLFAKSKEYHYDYEAILEPANYPAGPGNTKPSPPMNGEREGENANIRGNIHNIGPRSLRNKRSVWTINTRPGIEDHRATYPPELIEPCIRAGCPKGGIVLDPFMGSGTTGLVALQNVRDFLGIELSPGYVAMARRRLKHWMEQSRLDTYDQADNGKGGTL